MAPLDQRGPRSVTSDHLARGDPRHPLHAASDPVEALSRVALRGTRSKHPFGIGCRGRVDRRLVVVGLRLHATSGNDKALSGPASQKVAEQRADTDRWVTLGEATASESLDDTRRSAVNVRRVVNIHDARTFVIPRGPLSATTASRSLHGPIAPAALAFNAEHRRAHQPLRSQNGFRPKGHRGKSSNRFVDRPSKRSYHAWTTTIARVAAQPRSTSRRESWRRSGGRKVRRSIARSRTTAGTSSSSRNLRPRVDQHSRGPLRS